MINEYPINTFKGETRREIEEYIEMRESKIKHRIDLLIAEEI